MPLSYSRLRRIPAALLAALMVVAVALADYLTGYEVRLSILYLGPIAIATWSGGVVLGLLTALAATGCWLASFPAASANFYSDQVYYYWEGSVMLGTFVAFVLLLARLRQALAQADARFMRVLKEMRAGVYVADDRGRLLYANPALHRFAGEATPDSAGEFEQHLAEAPGHEDAGQGRDSGGFESRLVRDTRTGNWYLMQSGLIPWTAGRSVSLRVLTDITSERNAQALQRRHEKMLHRSARTSALAEVASSLAHEINQPLMAIATYTDACLRLLESEDHDKAELARALEKCRGQTARVADIVVRLRDIIRKRQPASGPADGNAIVTEALALVRPQLEDNDVAVQLSLPTASPPLLGDRTLLVQVLVNLLQNAIDAMAATPAGDRQIAVRVSADTDAVTFLVEDRGPGVAEADRDRIFTPFFSTKSHGLGLGLAISRSIAETHGGRLALETGAAGGARFRLVIPKGVQA